MRKLIVIILSIGLLLTACGKGKQESQNIEQIQAEQGIPIRQITVTPETFSRELIYNSSLKGVEESTAKAMVSDVVVSINRKVGDRVKAGEVIVRFPQNTPAAQFDQATTAFNSLKQAYERMQRLQAQGAISQQDLDNIETQYKVAAANLQASRKMIEVSAPIDGIITNIMVNAADHVFPGADLFTVAKTSSYRATLWVPESDKAQIKQGTPAIANWNGNSLRGSVKQVALAFDPQNKAFRVETEFANTNPAFAPGLTTEVRLLIQSKANAIVVQRQHLVRENDKSFVWLNIDGVAHKQEVQIGLDNQLSFEIVSGLQSGDLLITEGISQLKDNSKLLVVE